MVSEAQLAFLRSIDTPTVCNLIEIVAPERRGAGYTASHLHCPFPNLPPMVGFAKTATICARDPVERPKLAANCIAPSRGRWIATRSASHSRAANLTSVSSTARSKLGRLMILSTSPVAVCCSRASSRSRVSSATSVSSPGGDALERGTAVGASLRFGSGVFRRRPLICSPPALERLFVAFPVGRKHPTRAAAQTKK